MNLKQWRDVLALLGASSQMVPVGDNSAVLRRLVARLEHGRSRRTTPPRTRARCEPCLS